MKFFLAFCLIVGAASAALVRPPLTDTYAIALHEQRQFNIFESTRNVIQNLIDNLRTVAKEATDAMGTFTTSMQDEAKQIREKIVNDIKKLRDRVATAINNVEDKLIDSGVGVVGCISTSREEAAELFNHTLTKSLACVDDRIRDVAAQLESLSTIASGATDFGNKIMEDMRHCTAENGNILSVGACLGNVAIRTEMKVAVFATQTTLTIGRISLTLATFPASLEVCAGNRLVEAGVATAKIVMEIGSCSASTVYTTMSGSGSQTSESSAIDTAGSSNSGLLLALPSDEPIIVRQ